jgi:hypothetical protein
MTTVVGHFRMSWPLADANALLCLAGSPLHLVVNHRIRPHVVRPRVLARIEVAHHVGGGRGPGDGRRAPLGSPDNPEAIFPILLFLLVNAICPANQYAKATPVTIRKRSSWAPMLGTDLRSL